MVTRSSVWPKTSFSKIATAFGSFPGFGGAGKTTELFGLKQRLESPNGLVLYADALSYINPAGPIDVSDLVLAGAYGEKLKDRQAAVAAIAGGCSGGCGHRPPQGRTQEGPVTDVSLLRHALARVGHGG